MVPLQLGVHVPAILGLILVATLDGLTPLLFVLAFLAGASQLSVGSLIRARWSKIYTGTPQLRTAFAMESLVDEVVFIAGPTARDRAGAAGLPECGPAVRDRRC